MIKLERIVPKKEGKNFLDPVVTFNKSGVVYLSRQAVILMGLKLGQRISIYLDQQNNLYVGDGSDFQLRVRGPKDQQPGALCFYNKNFVQQLTDRLDWPLQPGKLSRVSYTVSATPITVEGVNVYKLQ
jgi:hypothetical protein